MGTKLRNETFTDAEGKQVKVMFSTLPAAEAFRLKVTLSKYILPTIGGVLKDLPSLMKQAKAVKSSGKSYLDMDIDIDFSNIAELLMEKMEAEELLNLMLRLLAQTKVDNVDIDGEQAFSQMFSGDFGLLYKVIGSILEANFGSLFGKSGTGTPSTAKVLK